MANIKFDLDDFAFLWWTAMGNFTHEQPHRFEVNDKYTSRPYKDGEGWLYWVGHQDGAADALLSFKILQAEGYKPNLLWDMAENTDGSVWAHCILTTYRHDEQMEPWPMEDKTNG